MAIIAIRQRGERGGFLDYCFEHIALQRNSPSPSQVPFKLTWKARGSRPSFRIPTINRVISGFTHLRAIPVPWQFHRNGMQVPLLGL
jgi:hypothetical protein